MTVFFFGGERTCLLAVDEKPQSPFSGLPRSCPRTKSRDASWIGTALLLTSCRRKSLISFLFSERTLVLIKIVHNLVRFQLFPFCQPRTFSYQKTLDLKMVVFGRPQVA